MITQSQSPSIPTPTPYPFKFYILHKTRLFETTPCDFRKRCYKHIHSLTLKPKNKSFLNKISLPKTLHSVHLENSRPGKDQRFVKKFVKPYKKYLRDFQGPANLPKIQKLLPLLANLRVPLKQESLRVLAFQSDIKKLHFDITASLSKKINGEKLFKKVKTPLSRSLARIKGLKTLSVSVARQDMLTAKLLLEIIDQNVSLDSLIGFSLYQASGMFLDNLQQFHEQKASINKVLAKLTHLYSDHATWYTFLTSSGNLPSLSNLNLEFHSKEVYCNTKDLFCFHDFQKLKNFTLSLTADSLPFEMDFFENFSLPSSLEDLKLTLTGFSLSLMNDNDALSSQFFQRLQDAKGVRALNLTITENAANSAFIAKFACLLIKCFANLETLEWKNNKEKLSLFGKGSIQAKALDFPDFWTAIFPSKETLQSISLSVNEIIFPEGVNTTLEGEFPRLQKLELKNNISSGTELSRFCQKTPSLRDVTLMTVKLQDEERLKIFLDSMKYIPEGSNFDILLDVKNIKQKPLIDCLKKYIGDVKVKGRFEIHFRGVQLEDEQAYGELLKLVLEKGCFEPFRMVATDLLPLFSVTKTFLVEARKGFIPNRNLSIKTKN